MRRWYSASEPSHQCMFLGRVSWATWSTHCSTGVGIDRSSLAKSWKRVANARRSSPSARDRQGERKGIEEREGKGSGLAIAHDSYPSGLLRKTADRPADRTVVHTEMARDRFQGVGARVVRQRHCPSPIRSVAFVKRQRSRGSSSLFLRNLGQIAL